MPAGGSIYGERFRGISSLTGVHFHERATPDADSKDRVVMRWCDTAGQLQDLRTAWAQGTKGSYWIGHNEPQRSGALQGATFGFNYVMANSMAMTKWELEQRMRRTGSHEPTDTEWVWRYVGQPVKRLSMLLKFAPGMEQVRPFLRCNRYKSYPDFPIVHGRNTFEAMSPDDFTVDEKVTREELHNLAFDPEESVWPLSIDTRIAGYAYELRWKLPEPREDLATTDATNDCQRVLLGLRARTISNQQTTADTACLEFFKEQTSQLLEPYRSTQLPHEETAAYLLVYDPDTYCIRAVMTFPMQPLDHAEFEVPLGEGGPSAAFLRRTVVGWSKRSGSRSLIRPRRFPGIEARHILAIPVFYRYPPGTKTQKLRCCRGEPSAY